MAIFKTENLSFTYPAADKKALDNVSIEVNQGELVLLMGKTGSGKSTLLRLLKKELAPNGTIDGNIINNARSIGFVQQNPETSFVSGKVRGELAFALENQCLPNDEIAVRIGETASFFNLNSMLDAQIAEISGGEKSTVAIASAMIADVEVLILDEPFAQLDPKATQQIISLIKRLNDELGVTVILSTHTCEGLLDICDKIIFLENGEFCTCTEPSIAAGNDNLINYFPIYTSLFEEHPLSIKSAIPLASKLKAKPLDDINFANTALEARRITFAYGKREKDILSELNYKAYEGKINAIIGANGSGKTTLLKALAGIKKCYAGKIKTSGKVAYMPQNVRYLFTKDTVGEEISAKTAEKFGLKEFLTRHPYDLSGGQMQKLALAILSEQNFDILLLDEPTKGLDYFNKLLLKDYFKALVSDNKTIIFVSHDIDFVSEISDYISFLSDGIITITGDRRRVLSSLDFYTSSVRRITRPYLDSAVAVEDLL